MRVLRVRNVEAALQQGYDMINYSGMLEDSRNGMVRSLVEPLSTVYMHPTERVLFCPVRDANPFFHYMESMWMLVGRDDAKVPGYYAAQIKTYANADGSLDGAYGYRWFNYFGFDQVRVIIEQLAKDPTTRRCVLQMWDARDLTRESLDKPCNTQCMFRVINGELNMAVLCRSNDAIWGAYGANAVHFSILQEFIAVSAGCRVGTMTQVSFNMHVYTERDDVKRYAAHRVAVMAGREYPQADWYGVNIPPVPLFTPDSVDIVEHEIRSVIRAYHYSKEAVLSTGDFITPAARTAICMHESYAAHKAGDYHRALGFSDRIEHEDWRAACGAWLARREEKHRVVA